jgi:heme o synthase
MSEPQKSELSLAEPRDFWQLLKPRVMSLVVFTALVGMVMAPHKLHPFLAFVSLLCIAVGAGASGALNMWYDADIDAVMLRTQQRPIPAGKVTQNEALGFGLFLSIASTILLGVVSNWLAAGLLGFTIFFYVVIYTMWLKRSTAQNIVIGGAAGAFPPVVAWAAMSGTLTLTPIILFLIIFIWTPPHFWALALVKNEDYKRANIPMLPVVAGEKMTRLQILIYSLILVPFTLLPYALGFATKIYGGIALVSGLVFLYLAFDIYRFVEGEKSRKASWRLFGYSIFYLFLLFFVLLLESLFYVR